MQTYLSDKMPPKEVKINESKKLDFLKISIKFSIFFTPYMTYFKTKKFNSQKGCFSNFSTQNRKIELSQNKEKGLF